MKLSKVENLLIFYSKISFCFVKRPNILFEIITKNPSFKGFYQIVLSELSYSGIPDFVI